jgi:hypothetical protein
MQDRIVLRSIMFLVIALFATGIAAAQKIWG